MSKSKKKYYIYPAIGIARVGNSDTDYLISPEVMNQKLSADTYKDKLGRVKPQAARFRIYAIDEDGSVVEEVIDKDGEDSVKIQWSVHIANRKAINYEFQNAMDLGQLAIDCPLRNADIKDLEERQRLLLLDPGSRSIEGTCRQPSNANKDEDFCFDSAKFYEGTAYEQDVYLGELRTDEKGRLLVFGGRGKSASFDASPAITFANNQGWHDDVSDGTVRATLTINGKQHAVEPAMVAITPPNFAPGIEGTVTLLDVVENLFEQENLISKIKRVSFYRDIYPIFKSLVDNQAVNEGFYFLFGENAPANFTEKHLLKKLASNDKKHRDLRTNLFKQFRPSVSVTKKQRDKALKSHAKQLKNENHGLALQVGKIANQALLESQQALQADQLPPFYGDTFGDYDDNPLAGLSLTDRQYDALKQWSQGDFINDMPDKAQALNNVEDLDLQEQPKALTRGHLAQCLGGPFHPGIELTWFLRRISMWDIDNPIDCMRLNILPANQAPQDFFGPVLTPKIALAQMFNASGPGTLTRFMGVPWQTDEASCRSGQDYDPAYYLPLASFWSARVPNQVLGERSFERLNDDSLPPLQRLKHLNYRQDWLRFFNSTKYETQINGMVKDWDKIGIVQKRKLKAPLKTDHYALDSLWVESEVNKKFMVNDPSFRQLLHMEALASDDCDKADNQYIENLRELEKDDCDFAENNEPERIKHTRAQLFGGKSDASGGDKA